MPSIEQANASIEPLAGAAALLPADVPTFRWRARVNVAGGQPAGTRTFKIGIDAIGVPPVSVTGTAWTDWIVFGPIQAATALQGYPNNWLRRFPVRIMLRFVGVTDPASVDAELVFDGSGAVIPLHGDLFGPTLGINVWRDSGGYPHAASLADYNQQFYWPDIDRTLFPEDLRPQHFVLVDRFIGGDEDRRNWGEGIERTAQNGCNGLLLPASKPIHDLLVQAGLHRVAAGTYMPPGYAFSFGVQPRVPPATQAQIDTWAKAQAKTYTDSGYAPTDVAVFAMSDEPAFYYPENLRNVAAQPEALAAFRQYLKDQGLQPADLGAATWDTVLPLGRSGAVDLPSSRLFYWTGRFFPYASAQHFANCTRALERAFYPGLPVFTNWNFFAGRCYVPGGSGKNVDATSPDASLGSHDWLEFGRLRGGTAMWTEDWIFNYTAYQWSFYAAKLRSAAEKSGVGFGGYLIGATCTDLDHGLLRKALSIVGNGGKAIRYYEFGPEYNFAGNCYSDIPGVFRQIADANQVIGKAEDLLWPGRKPRAQVAILAPRSSEFWDQKGIPNPTGISDATNNKLNAFTVDYMAEVANIYLALQHANIPADFVDEDDLTNGTLNAYRVLYATEPDIPEEGQQGIAAWVKNGGTLVTVAGTGSGDRYDQPCSVLADLAGVKTAPWTRTMVRWFYDLKPVAKQKIGYTAWGARSTVVSHSAHVLATFDDGTPAVLRNRVWQGRVIHFPWFPGVSYSTALGWGKTVIPSGFSEILRLAIISPTQEAGVVAPVVADHSMVETPVLLSDAGAAVTVLNWNPTPISSLTLQIRLPFAPSSVASARQGALALTDTGGEVSVALPVDDADVIMLRR